MKLVSNGKDLVVPATLMPVVSFDGTLITTAQPHGLQKFLEWSAQDESRPKSILVGAEPGPVAKRSMRGGIMLHRVAGLTFPAPNQILLPAGIVNSFRVGTRDVGYIHVPTMHLLEILSLLGTSTSGSHGRYRPERFSGGARRFSCSPPPVRHAYLGEILGIRSGSSGKVAGSIPYWPRARIPPGFYASPLPYLRTRSRRP